MSEQIPATPAPAATPGSNVPGQSNPSTVTPTPASTPGTTGTDNSEGKVTLSAKEHAQLLRDQARLKSFQRRKDFFKKSAVNGGNDGGTGDEVPEEIQRLETEKAKAEQEALKAKVTLKVRDLLDQDDFKNLPKSTRDLILQRPHLLSDADNVDEAMLDIEDFVREQVASLSVPNRTQPSGAAANPPGHETPTAVNPGGPVAPTAVALENTEGLRGPARSQAVLRNALKKAKGLV